MLHFVVPAGYDDPLRPTGGNRYDQRLIAELRATGQAVLVRPVPVQPVQPVQSGPVQSVCGDVEAALAAVPDGATLLVDGLLASAAADVLVAASRRVRLAVLAHMLVGELREEQVLAAASALITTSRWGARYAIERYGIRSDRVHVAVPGADPAPVARGTPERGGLLCVAAVAGHKGHDVLVDALAALADLPWRLVCAGALDRDPAFVADVQARAVAAGIADRIIYAGPLSGAALERAYADADVLVHPTRGEMYGLVVTEALAHGLPVIASDVGGVPEAFGARSGDPAPGQLVPPGDSGALGDALRAWLTSPERRAALRAGALRRRAALPTWSATADAVRAALTTLTP